eukprot:TRINITY_DN37560_c0_g1_i1.p1 TRINITY_DN37560_c0_g1~~TRINITY_DN37560_c0_g1_i1.p1  ORF type:complete len:1128 (+),score=253.14 TRINITY_DN37560_c0_g1_i1:79-3384(+)
MSAGRMRRGPSAGQMRGAARQSKPPRSVSAVKLPTASANFGRMMSDPSDYSLPANVDEEDPMEEDHLSSSQTSSPINSRPQTSSPTVHSSLPPAIKPLKRLQPQSTSHLQRTSESSARTHQAGNMHLCTVHDLRQRMMTQSYSTFFVESRPGTSNPSWTRSLFNAAAPHPLEPSSPFMPPPSMKVLGPLRIGPKERLACDPAPPLNDVGEEKAAGQEARHQDIRSSGEAPALQPAVGIDEQPAGRYEAEAASPVASDISRPNPSPICLPDELVRKLSKDKSKGTLEAVKQKPTEEQRLNSRSRRKPTKTATINLQSKTTSRSQEPLKKPSTSVLGDLLPSIEQAEKRYTSQLSVAEYDGSRLKVHFNRFAEDGEIPKECLYACTMGMGFVTVTEEKVKGIIAEMCQFATLDWYDFLDFFDNIIATECNEVEARMNAWLASASEEHPSAAMQLDERLRCFLLSVGIACPKGTISEMLEAGGLKDRWFDTPEELIRLLAAYHACEGFTNEELKEAKDAFEECEEDTAFRQSSEGRHIQAGEISNGLLNMESLYCAPHLHKVMDRLGEDRIENGPPACFYEFIAAARSLRQMQMQELATLFEEADDDSDCLVSVEELHELVKPLGFNLLEEELEELLAEVEIGGDAFLDFDTLWSFVKAAREQNGFTKAEADELTSQFESFCDESGEMPNLQVHGLLMYIGHESSLEEVKDMVEEVDFNGNGTMDSGEFLRLMRLQKEQNLANYNAALATCKLENPGNVLAVVQNSLHTCLQHRPQILQRLLDEQPREELEKAGDSFENFARLAESLRKRLPKESRKWASFKETELEALHTVFESHGPSEEGYLGIGQVLMMLGEVMEVHTRAGRDRMYEALEKARKTAVAAGGTEEEAGDISAKKVSFMTVVHLTRAHLDVHLRDINEKEDAMLSKVKFSKSETSGFRKVFNKLAKEYEQEQAQAAEVGCMVAAKPRRRRMAPTKKGYSERESSKEKVRMPTYASFMKESTKVFRVPGSEIIKLLRPLGLKVQLGADKARLNRKLSELSADYDGVDFTAFLGLVQWMLDENFGNINLCSKEAIEKGNVQGLETDEDDDSPKFSEGANGRRLSI